MNENPNQAVLEQIDADYKQAMRERDDVVKLTIRSIKTALTEASKAGEGHELSQDEVLSILQREAKRRRDAAAEYERLGAQAQAAQELAELAVVERYLPRQLSEEEIEIVARRVIADTGASSQRDMGRVMSAIMDELAGTADGRTVSQVVRRLLTDAA